MYGDITLLQAVFRPTAVDSGRPSDLRARQIGVRRRLCYRTWEARKEASKGRQGGVRGGEGGEILMKVNAHNTRTHTHMHTHTKQSKVFRCRLTVTQFGVAGMPVH